jgi:hypothetical protein
MITTVLGAYRDTLRLIEVTDKKGIPEMNATSILEVQ